MKWTEIYTTSELEEFAKQFWTEKKAGGSEPTLSDMFIAGFTLGVRRSTENAEAKIKFESGLMGGLVNNLKERNENLRHKANIEKELSDKLFERIRVLEKDLEIFRALESAVKNKA